jgi:hypothetical protein
MKRIFVIGAFFGAMGLVGGAYAGSFEDTCLQVSADWGTQGDVPAQCSCLAELTDADSALEEELMSLAENYSSDADAYEAGSASAKEAFDSCSVDS